MWLDRVETIWKKLSKRPEQFLILDIAQGIAKIAYVEKFPAHWKVYKYRVQPLPFSEDPSPRPVVQFVQDFITKNEITVKDAVLSISDADALGVAYLPAPDLPRKEDVLAAVQSQLKEEVVFDLAEAYVDWQVVRETYEEEGKKKKDATFIVIKKDILDRYLKALEECALNPICVTTNVLAYSNLLQALAYEQKSCAILDLDFQQATLTFFVDNKIHFSRNMPISWEKITQSLTEILVSDKGKIELTYEEAEDIKNTVGFPSGAYDENRFVRDNVQLKHVVSMLRPILEVLTRELKFSFDYYAANFNVEPPPVLYITGGGANLKGMDQYLSRELGIRVCPLPVPDIINLELVPELGGHRPDSLIAGQQGVDASKPMPGPTGFNEERKKKIINASGAKQVLHSEDLGSGSLQGLGAVLGIDKTSRANESREVFFSQLTTIFGAALNPKDGVNLLPLEIRRKKLNQLERMCMRVGSITAIFIMLLLLLVVKLQTKDFTRRLAAAQIHLSVIKEIEDTTNKLNESTVFQEKLLAGYIPLEGVLKVISAAIPRQVILRRVNFSQGSQQLNIDGVVAEKAELAEQVLTTFMQDMEKTVFVLDATLVSIEGVGGIQNFSITCDLVK
jgi:type IV pilus assembly protein PilM